MSPVWGRSLIAALWVVTAVMLQVVVFSRLPLPGATPDVVLVVVAGWALRRGSLEGALIGFCAGLVFDLAPPAVGPLGLWALVLALVGYLVGLVADDGQRSSLTPLVVVGVAGVVSVSMYSALAVIIGDPPITWTDFARQLPGQALYTVLLALVVLPALSSSIRRFEPSTSRW